MQFRDLDFDTGVYWTRRRWDNNKLRDGLKPKGEAERSYPLDRVAHIIKCALKGRITGPESFVFAYQVPRTKRWHHYTKDYLYKIYDKARDKAGLSKEATPYAFSRNSMASQLAQAGASDDQIAMGLDNSSQVVRKHYKHVFPQTVGKVLEFRDKANLFPVVSQEKKEILSND
ncbi:MAG: tyrosine-type recombinase/integrase [Nitrospinae bacterium]|nr:tyrosine-type recombinase/integrase [Nitrospinota bacterium]